MKLGASRYAKRQMDGFYYVETVNDKRLTTSMVRVERDSLPEGVADRCDALQAYAFNAVELGE